MSESVPEKPETTSPAGHPVAKAVDTFIHRIRDIEQCDRTYVAMAVERHKDALKQSVAELRGLAKAVTPTEDAPESHVLKHYFDTIRRFDRVIHSQEARTLRVSLFLGVFSAYDAFTGDLIAALFAKRAELFHKLGGTVPVGDVLRASSLEDFKSLLVSAEVDRVRRQSYVEQFDSLEKLFDVTLTAFTRWPDFVEVTQRRNLFAHCNGVVTEQYIKICRDHKVLGGTVGEELALDDDYFAKTCRLLAEVAVKLGQTLWRKTLPYELAVADRHLHFVAYEALQFAEWEWASIVGEFAISQRKTATERNRMIAFVNHCIALKFGGRWAEADRILSSFDWTAMASEFKLAHAVLRDDFEMGAQLMRRIGPQGDFIDRVAYHTWPLFREFRATETFTSAYRDIYGTPFVEQLRVVATQAESEAQAAVESEKSTEPAATNFTLPLGERQ